MPSRKSQPKQTPNVKPPLPCPRPPFPTRMNHPMPNSENLGKRKNRETPRSTISQPLFPRQMNHPMPNSEETGNETSNPPFFRSLPPTSPHSSQTLENHPMPNSEYLGEKVSVCAIPIKIRSPKVFPVLIEKKISVGQIIDMAGCALPSILRVPIKVRWLLVMSEEALKTNVR